MKKNTLVLSMTLLVFAMLTMAFTTTNDKKIKLKGTTWVSERTMFLADVGNEKWTYTIHFVSDKEVEITRNYFTPAHPSMRMMPDGEVPVNPAQNNTFEEKGTYKVKKKTVTIYIDGKKVYSFKYCNDHLEPLDEPGTKKDGFYYKK